MNFPISIYQDVAGVFIAECPIVPDCKGQGKTREEAIQNVKESIKKSLEVRHEKKLMLTVENLEIEIPLKS